VVDAVAISRLVGPAVYLREVDPAVYLREVGPAVYLREVVAEAAVVIW
jgi:hypothetical protein